MKKEFVGIDVSKNTLDVSLYHLKAHKVFANSQSGFNALLDWVGKQSGSSGASPVFCFEHTGIYSLGLCAFLQERTITYHLVPGLQIKRSLGIRRGKNDKIDAEGIARYAYLHREELKPYDLPAKSILKLRTLLTYRSKLVRQAAAHKASLTEMKAVLGAEGDPLIQESSQRIIMVLKEQLRTIEKQLKTLIEEDESLEQTHRNIRSIKGVGLILASTLIARTNNFEAFDTWRQFACYAGIAPFEHRSGISYKGKARVSTLGNRQIKCLLSQAAATAILHNAEMKTYYDRRVGEGKSKMATLNIIRNKLVSRIFAVARRKSPYVDIYKFAA